MRQEYGNRKFLERTTLKNIKKIINPWSG